MAENPYNKYPEGFLQEFKEPVIFRLTERWRKPDPDQPGAVLMPMSINVPATSRVTYNGQVVDLALINNIDAFGNIDLDRDNLLLGRFNNGMIHLSPNNPKHRKIFEFLNHCHWNKDSPYTYQGVDHIIEKYSPASEAKKSMEERAVKKKAILVVEQLNDAQLISTYSKIGTKNPKRLTIEEMRNEMDELAFNEPELILDATKGISFNAAKQVKAVEPNIEEDDDLLDDLLDGLSEEDLEDESQIVDSPVGELTAEDVVNVALKSKLIYKHNPSRIWKIKKNGHTLFHFKAANAGVGTAEEQLVKAASEDKKLLAILQGLIA